MRVRINIEFEVSARVKRALKIAIPAAIILGASVAYAAVPNMFANGDTLSAQKMNDNFAFVQGQITTDTLGPRTPSSFRAEVSSTSTINISDNTLTTVIYDVVNHDLASEYNKTTGKFTPTHGGIYFVSCGLNFNVLNTDFSIGIRKNDQITLALGTTRVGSVNVDGAAIASTTVQLAVGDSISCVAYQNSGSTQPAIVSYAPLKSHFSAARLY